MKIEQPFNPNKEKKLVKMNEQRLTIFIFLQFILIIIILIGCGTGSVIRDKEKGDGIAKVYPVNEFQAWHIVDTILLSIAAPQFIEKHKDYKNTQSQEEVKQIFRDPYCKLDKHKDKNYVIAECKPKMDLSVLLMGSLWSPLGTVLGVWIEPMDTNNTQITIVSRRTNPASAAKTLLNSDNFHKYFAKGVEIIKKGYIPLYFYKEEYPLLLPIDYLNKNVSLKEGDELLGKECFNSKDKCMGKELSLIRMKNTDKNGNVLYVTNYDFAGVAGIKYNSINSFSSVDFGPVTFDFTNTDFLELGPQYDLSKGIMKLTYKGGSGKILLRHFSLGILTTFNMY